MPYVWAQARQAPIGKLLLCAVLVVRHIFVLAPLALAAHGSAVHRLVRGRPEIFQMVVTPYIASNWDVPTRFARIVDHCNTATAIGGLVDFPINSLVNVLRLDAIDSRFRITLDQARWLLRDGQMVLSLWYETDRLFQLAFCLSQEDGRRIAYIGGLQGRNEVDEIGRKLDVLNIYRDFTQAANGMRPRDFMVDAFKVLCRALDIVEIRAVADSNHPQRAILADVKLSYDEVWRERGGVDNNDGFFILPVSANRRAVEDIPAKKRGMYRKRYAMLDVIENDLIAASRLPPQIEIRS